MKKLILIALFSLSILSTYAQDSMFKEGDTHLKAGVGLRYFHPNVIASIDYCLVDGIFEEGSLGVGPYANIELETNDFKVGVGGRGTFHYPIVEDLDTYLGAGVGFRYNSWSKNINLIPSIFIGANYNLNEDISVYGELGSGISFLTVGVKISL